MRKTIFLLFALLLIPILSNVYAEGENTLTGWDHRKKITIDNTQVSGSSSLTNFPVLISITDSDLSSNTQSNGADIRFTSSDGSTLLDYEIESYDSSSGTLIAWVKIPTLSSSTDTILYMYYGNDSATDSQDANDVWSNNYSLVAHMNQESNDMLDSTVNENNLLKNGNPSLNAIGKIGNAVGFGANNNNFFQFSKPQFTDEATLSMWVSTNGIGSGGLLEFRPTNQSPQTHYPYVNGLLYFHIFRDARVDSISNNFDKTQIHYLTITSKPGTGNWKFYQNGNLMHQTSGDLTITMRDFPSIGKNQDSTANIIDEFRLSDIARTSDWINTQYNNQDSPSSFYSLGSLESQSNSSSAPQPPTSLTLSTQSSTQINLSWTAPSGTITGYKIERSNDNSTFTTINSNTGNSNTSYSDTNLSPNTQYYYRVSAINSIGTSSPSNTANTTTSNSSSAPSSPTSLTATTISQTQINLSWTAPTNNGGSQITGYFIERSLDGTNYTTIVSDTGTTSTTYSDTELTSSTQYYYRVSAINSVGTGTVSTSATATTTTQTSTPSAPTLNNSNYLDGGLFLLMLFFAILCFVLSAKYGTALLIISIILLLSLGISLIAGYDVLFIESTIVNYETFTTTKCLICDNGVWFGWALMLFGLLSFLFFMLKTFRGNQ